MVEVETEDGTKGVATGFGGPPACWLVEKHFARFIIGQDPRDTKYVVSFSAAQRLTNQQDVGSDVERKHVLR